MVATCERPSNCDLCGHMLLDWSYTCSLRSAVVHVRTSRCVLVLLPCSVTLVQLVDVVLCLSYTVTVTDILWVFDAGAYLLTSL